jgi:hypothetical protein
MSDEGEIGTAMIGGKATFYDDGPGLYGAAGPLLREMLGGDPTFRGESVTVCADDCVTVVLVDWCACGERGGRSSPPSRYPPRIRSPVSSSARSSPCPSSPWR